MPLSWSRPRCCSAMGRATGTARARLESLQGRRAATRSPAPPPPARLDRAPGRRGPPGAGPLQPGAGPSGRAACARRRVQSDRRRGPGAPALGAGMPRRRRTSGDPSRMGEGAVCVRGGPTTPSTCREWIAGAAYAAAEDRRSSAGTYSRPPTSARSRSVGGRGPGAPTTSPAPCARAGIPGGRWSSSTCPGAGVTADADMRQRPIPTSAPLRASRPSDAWLASLRKICGVLTGP